MSGAKDLRRWKGGAALAICVALSASPHFVEAQRDRSRQLREQIAEHPDDSSALCQLGWLRFVQEQELGLAAQSLLHGVEILGDPEDARLRRRLGACLYSLGRVREAQRDYERATACYERSLSFRPHPAVASRLEDARAMRDASWFEIEPQRSELAHAVGSNRRHAVLSDGPLDPSVAVGVGEEGEIVLSVYREGAVGSSVSVESLLHPNGDERVTLQVAPAPPGSRPTFVIRDSWNHRDCCDDEGDPDYTEGTVVLLAWQEGGGVWRVAEVANTEVTEGSVDASAEVSFTADGRVRVGRLGEAQARGALSGRIVLPGRIR